MRRKLLILAVFSILALGSGAMALTHAAAKVSSTPAAQVQQQVASPGADTNRQEVKDTNEKSEHESATGAEEKEKDEEKEDKNLPGGGHQDPEGANVDHQFEGVE